MQVAVRHVAAQLTQGMTDPAQIHLLHPRLSSAHLNEPLIQFCSNQVCLEKGKVSDHI